MKKLLIPLFLILFGSAASAQTADSLIFAPLTSTASATTFNLYTTGIIQLKYPSEVSVLWDRWAPIGAQVDTLWFERYSRVSGTWEKLRFYKEQTGEYDTILVRDRPVSIIVPIHALPVSVRVNTGGTQTDTVKVEYRRP